jgi:NAD(P)H-dependent flavin oxidoreductase YrpB (nitropropane dioxygenase family)
MTGFRSNGFTRQFELDWPIVQAPMGGVAGPELAAAVANAGGLGMLPVWTMPPADGAEAIRVTRALTSGSFGVNVRADLVQLDVIGAAIDAGASIVHLFWGDPTPCVPPIRAAGARMMVTVGDPEIARVALDAGAQVLVAQGVEAGGHVFGTTPLRALLDAVVPLAGEVPVLAAGGLTDAEDVADVMSRGAAGAVLGTRFVATEESNAHADYKRLLIEAGGGDATVLSECFEIGWSGAPHRHLKNGTFSAWEAAGAPEPGQRPGEGDIVLRAGGSEIPRYSVMPPQRGMSGDIADAVLYAGTGVGKIRDCPTAAEVLSRLTAGL